VRDGVAEHLHPREVLAQLQPLHDAPVAATVGDHAGGVEAGAPRRVERARQVVALRDDERRVHIEDLTRALRRVPRVEPGVVGEDVGRRHAERQQALAHRADLVVVDAPVVAGQQHLVHAPGLVERGRGLDAVLEHRAQAPVAVDLSAQHQRDLGARRIGHIHHVTARRAQHHRVGDADHRRDPGDHPEAHHQKSAHRRKTTACSRAACRRRSPAPAARRSAAGS
jgi:hypothetical protein